MVLSGGGQGSVLVRRRRADGNRLVLPASASASLERLQQLPFPMECQVGMGASAPISFRDGTRADLDSHQGSRWRFGMRGPNGRRTSRTYSLEANQGHRSPATAELMPTIAGIDEGYPVKLPCSAGACTNAKPQLLSAQPTRHRSQHPRRVTEPVL
jgi:hypothetical protein